MTDHKQKMIQRVRHHPEERLQASDLNTDMAYEAMLRRLHLRSLHDTWGAALGLRLALRNDGKAVLVAPGLAYDCLGRELLLTVSTALDAPLRPAGAQGQSLVYDLTVRYVEIDSKQRRDSGGDLCMTTNELGLDFRWALAGEGNSPAAEWLSEGIRLGEEVPLGRFILDAQDTLSGPSYLHRRNAHPLLRPHLASNIVQPEWQAEIEKVDDFTNILKSATFTSLINTAVGGFSQDTHYFVRLLPTTPLQTLQESGKLIGPLVSISNPTYQNFSLRVTYALHDDPANESDVLVLLLREIDHTRLLWLGAEPVTGCTPGMTQIYTVYGYLALNVTSLWTTALKLFGT